MFCEITPVRSASDSPAEFLGNGESVEASLCLGCAGPRSAPRCLPLGRRCSRGCRLQRIGIYPRRWVPGRPARAGARRSRGDAGALSGVLQERSRTPCSRRGREATSGTEGRAAWGLASAPDVVSTPLPAPASVRFRGGEGGDTSGGDTSGSGGGRGRGEEDRAEPAAPGPPLSPPLRRSRRRRDREPGPEPGSAGPCQPEPPRARRGTMAAENRSAPGGGAPWAGLPGESRLGAPRARGGGRRASRRVRRGDSMDLGCMGTGLRAPGGCGARSPQERGRCLCQLSHIPASLRERRGAPRVGTLALVRCLGMSGGVQPCQGTGVMSGTPFPCFHPNQHRSRDPSPEEPRVPLVTQETVLSAP